MTQVITYQAPNGETLNLARSQARRFRISGEWPKNSRGEEFCSVSHGLHTGEPTYTDNEIKQIAARIAS